MLYRGLFWIRSLPERDMIALRFLSDENGVLSDGSLTVRTSTTSACGSASTAL